MVEEDVLQRFRVLEKTLQRTLRQLGEGFVRRSEDGKRSLALERVDKSGGGQRLGERGEISGFHGDGHDVFFSFFMAVRLNRGLSEERDGQKAEEDGGYASFHDVFLVLMCCYCVR
jgi:hypothetical protein